MGTGYQLDQKDYELFYFQVKDFVFDAVIRQTDVDWEDYEVCTAVDRLAKGAIEEAWRVGSTIEQWEDAAVEKAVTAVKGDLEKRHPD